MSSTKYKSVLCKHFGQSGTCSYGEKCQFAHGFQELQTTKGGSTNDGTTKKVAPNPSNFKIVKCKSWEASKYIKFIIS